MLELTRDEFLDKVTRYRILVDREELMVSELGIDLTNALVCVVAESRKRCFDELNDREIDAVEKYLDEHVRSEGFMPFPSCFVAPGTNVEERKLELRPRYREINRLIAEAKAKYNSPTVEHEDDRPKTD